jgi:multicomponent Na+:H+ antiporter subunit A
MLIPLLIPIFILALGAVLLPLLDGLPRMRGLCLLGAGSAGLSLISLGWLAPQLPIESVVSTWRPLVLFGAPLSLAVTRDSWMMAMVLSGATFLSLVACQANEERPTGGNVALILAATATGVAAFFASSFVTLIIAWAATDLLLTGAMMRYGPKGTRRAGLALGSGLLATSALWGAHLLAQPEGVSGFLALSHFSGLPATLFDIAVILRLGLVPLHLWRPIDLEIEPAQMIPLVVIPTLLGFDLLTYLPALTAGLPSALFVLAALTVLAGGFVAWSETEERSSLAGAMVAETGLAVLAAANAGKQAVAIAIAAAVAWALGITVFSLTPGWSGRRFWRGLPSLIALLSLAGLPLTLGFVVRFAVYGGLEADLLALIMALVGESFVIAALVRLWFWAEPRSLPQRRFMEAAYLVVFFLVALVLVVAGLFPETFIGRAPDTQLTQLSELIGGGGIAGWAGWALPIVAGVTLFLAGEGLRQRLEGGWQGLGALLRMEWLYGLLFLTLRWIVALMRGMAGLIEGEGALLWTVVILLIVVLYVLGASGPTIP